MYIFWQEEKRRDLGKEAFFVEKTLEVWRYFFPICWGLRVMFEVVKVFLFRTWSIVIFVKD